MKPRTLIATLVAAFGIGTASHAQPRSLALPALSEPQPFETARPATLHHAMRAVEAHPRRVARLDRDGRIVGDWMQPTSARGTCPGFPTPLFDAFQYEYVTNPVDLHDIEPVGGDACFSDPPPMVDLPSLRWGLDASRPRHVMPFGLSQPAPDGVRVVRLGVLNFEEPGVQYIILQVWDDFDGACEGEVASGFVDFIIIDLGEVIPASTDMYFWVSVDLCEVGTTLGMPADAEGALDFTLASTVDLEKGIFEYPGRASFALWSTHPGGPGTLSSTNNHVVDLDDGPAFQCINYLLVGACPGPVTVMVALEADLDPCGANVLGDADCDADVDDDDLEAFAIAVADPGLYATLHPSCDRLCTCDLDGDGLVTVFDIDLFIANLDGSSPAPTAADETPRAGNFIRLFISEEGVMNPEGDVFENNPITGSPPEESLHVSGDASRLWVWAQLSAGGQVINGISFDLLAQGGVRFTNFHAIDNTNVDNFEGARWDYINPGVMADDQAVQGVCFVALRSFGVRSDSDAGGDAQFDPITLSVPIAYFDVETEGYGRVFIRVGAPGVSRRNGPGSPGETLFLGFGDEGDGLLGGSYSTISTQGDACFAPSCANDLNADDVVNTADLGFLISKFGGPGEAADVNCDGVVNTADLGLLLNAFGHACP